MKSTTQEADMEGTQTPTEHDARWLISKHFVYDNLVYRSFLSMRLGSYFLRECLSFYWSESSEEEEEEEDWDDAEYD